MVVDIDQFEARRPEIIDALRRGDLVVLPTETVYGLAADATDAAAVARIFSAKGRPSHNPVIVHVFDRVAAQKIAHWNDIADKLADAFWPGPLTIVLRKKEGVVPDTVTANGPTVAVRSPAHPLFRAVLSSGLVLAAPSANRSNELSPTLAKHVHAVVRASAAFLVDGGPCDVGLESTVVTIRESTIEILRPGAITAKTIECETGFETKYRTEPQPTALASPGLLKKHYSPNKPLILGLENAENGDFIIAIESETADADLKLSSDPGHCGRQLFDALWNADNSDADRIVIERPPNTEPWRAINDRLRRASEP